MKKLFAKDKKLRENVLNIENKYFILKSIVKNFNFFTLIRWNAFKQLDNLTNKNSKVSLSNRCLLSVNKKRFNKLTVFSRHIFLKLIRTGAIPGLRKSS